MAVAKGCEGTVHAVQADVFVFLEAKANASAHKLKERQRGHAEQLSRQGMS